MSVVQVRYIRQAIEDRFSALIDPTDRPKNEREDVLLTRGLAALALQSEHPCSDLEASKKIFDGEKDQGLDAVAVELRADQPRICLVQAKWNHDGQAKFRQQDVDAMLYGLAKIVDLEFHLFNERFQGHASNVDEALKSGCPKITLVLALMRTEPLNTDICRRLEEGIAQYNRVVDMVDYRIFDLREIHRAILGDAAAPKIDARVQ